jgi:hypothetical protein
MNANTQTFVCASVQFISIFIDTGNSGRRVGKEKDRERSG